MTPPPGASAREDSADPEMLRRLERAVARLPRRQRLILLAIRLDDIGYDEIGGRLGLTSRQVEHQFARAIYKVHRQMEGERLRWWERWI
ncbi:MAG: sigma-70 region 4 domain-containing protein [Sphingomonas sp.]|uniref:sigma-70 region 4 domain-containing protein n=1 Tax=Sphingomonas sp. TaxID=28214 RepID=UPI003562CFDA